MEHIWKTNINSEKSLPKKEKQYIVFDSNSKKVKKMSESESHKTRDKSRHERKYSNSERKSRHRHRSSKHECHHSRNSDRYKKRQTEFQEPTVNNNYLTDEINRHNDTKRIDLQYPNRPYNNNRYQNNYNNRGNNYPNNNYPNNNYPNNNYQNNYRNNNYQNNNNNFQQGGYRKKNYYQPQLKNDVLEAIEKVDVKKSEKEPKKTKAETDTEQNYIKIPVTKNCKGFFVIPTNSKSNVQNIINAVNNSEPVKKQVTTKKKVNKKETKKVTNRKSKKVEKK